MTPEDVLTGGERAQLEAFVQAQRDEIAGLLDGLTEEQARCRLVRSALVMRAGWRA